MKCISLLYVLEYIAISNDTITDTIPGIVQLPGCTTDHPVVLWISVADLLDNAFSKLAAFLEKIDNNVLAMTKKRREVC